MKINRTYKKTSLRFGQETFIDEETMRIIATQTTVGQHQPGQCDKAACSHCPESAIRNLQNGAKLESFFSIFKLAA